MRYRLMMMAMFVTLVCNHPALGQSNNDTFSFPRVEGSESTVNIQYHQFLLMKHNSTIIALHVMPDPRYGWGGINYRWYQLTDGTDRFFVPSPERADGSENRSVRTGSGDTNEANQGSGWIQIGDLSIEWSKCGHNSGWLYLGNVDAELQIYPAQFSRIEDFTGNLDAKLWKSITPESRSDGP